MGMGPARGRLQAATRLKPKVNWKQLTQGWGQCLNRVELCWGMGEDSPKEAALEPGPSLYRPLTSSLLLSRPDKDISSIFICKH